MIGVELSGGLGNQFFRYAYARRLIKERGECEPLLLNMHHVDQHGGKGDIMDFRIYVNSLAHDVRRLVLTHGSLLQRILYTAYATAEKLSAKTRLNLHFPQSVIRERGLYVMNDPQELPPPTADT